MYADITHAPLDFESPPWDALSGACVCGDAWYVWGADVGQRLALYLWRRCPAGRRSAAIWLLRSRSSQACFTQLPPASLLAADDARDFVQSLLQREEMRRPTAEEALQHR